MKTIIVRRLQFDALVPDLEEVSERLDKIRERGEIDIINWQNFPNKPDVSFSIAYTDNELLLKYYVTEEYFRAEKTGTNQEVYEDSCVEFFVSPNSNGIYYNIEFNGIGTCLMESGTGRSDRKRTDAEIIRSIRRQSSAGSKPVSEKEGLFSWTITIAIPFNVFFHHELSFLQGETFMANFYKCGDRLRVPHYVTWNPVGTLKPDFHQPSFFGTLHFES
ncbi:MAG: carbohydrate-binding family 9-like protein [Bacteroidota bacterium]